MTLSSNLFTPSLFARGEAKEKGRGEMDREGQRKGEIKGIKDWIFVKE